MSESGPNPLLQLVDRFVGLLAAVNRPIALLGRNLSAGLIGAMVALALAQILSRALFSYTLDWAEELARVALVWSVLLVSPFAYRSGAHVAIGSLAASLPRIATSRCLIQRPHEACSPAMPGSSAFQGPITSRRFQRPVRMNITSPLVTLTPACCSQASRSSG